MTEYKSRKKSLKLYNYLYVQAIGKQIYKQKAISNVTIHTKFKIEGMRHISSSISSDELIRHFCHRTSIRHVPNIDKGTTILGEYQAKKMIFLNFDTAWIYAGYFKDIVSSNKTREKGEKKEKNLLHLQCIVFQIFQKMLYSHTPTHIIPIPVPVLVHHSQSEI